MRPAHALLLAGLSLVPLPVGAVRAQDAPAEVDDAAEALVKALASESAAARRAAEDALVALGESARATLESHAASDDAEVRARVRAVLRRLDEAARGATHASLTWAGLRGDPMRTGVAGGAIPAEKPTRLWSTDVAGLGLMQGSVVPGDERIVCLSNDGIVRTFATHDGARGWLANLESPITASAVLASDRLVVPTRGGLVALDVRTGRRVWEEPSDYGCEAAPAVSGGRVFAAFRSVGIRALDLVTGERLADWPLAPSGALLVDGDLVVAGTEDGHLVRLDAASRRVLWRIDLGSAPNMGPTLAAPGAVAVLARDRYLRVVGAEHGRTLWERRLPNASRSESLAASAGRLFLTDSAGALRAFDAGTGAQLWSRHEGMLEMGGPCATPERVLWGTRGRLMCRDAASGVWVWRLDLPAVDDAVPVVRDGVVYVLTNRELIALR